jgi:hypothetical protein
VIRIRGLESAIGLSPRRTAKRDFGHHEGVRTTSRFHPVEGT